MRLAARGEVRAHIILVSGGAHGSPCCPRAGPFPRRRARVTVVPRAVCGAQIFMLPEHASQNKVFSASIPTSPTLVHPRCCRCTARSPMCAGQTKGPERARSERAAADSEIRAKVKP